MNAFSWTLAQSTDSRGGEWMSRGDSVWGPSEQAQHPAMSTELGFAHSGDHSQQSGPETRAETSVRLGSSFSPSDTEGEAPTRAGSWGSVITALHVAPSLRCHFFAFSPAHYPLCYRSSCTLLSMFWLQVPRLL